jgi:hypothetical protein
VVLYFILCGDSETARHVPQKRSERRIEQEETEETEELADTSSSLSSLCYLLFKSELVSFSMQA